MTRIVSHDYVRVRGFCRPWRGRRGRGLNAGGVIKADPTHTDGQRDIRATHSIVLLSANRWPAVVNPAFKMWLKKIFVGDMDEEVIESCSEAQRTDGLISGVSACDETRVNITRAALATPALTVIS